MSYIHVQYFILDMVSEVTDFSFYLQQKHHTFFSIVLNKGNMLYLHG